jgi:hypothetical protein
MLRNNLALLALVPAIALGYSACVGEADTEDPEAVMEEEATIVAPNPALIGTFRTVKFEVGQLALLVLKSDGTYHRGTLVACFTGPCNPAADDGKYTLWYRGGEAFMSLYPNSRVDSTVDRYQYYLRGSALRITRVGEQSWMTLGKTDGAAWCDATNDCALQNLPVGPCATDWYCAANVCTYSCLPPDEPFETE